MFRRLIFLVLLTAGWTSVATAQLITKTVMSTDVELFQFSTGMGVATKVIVAKFVTNDLATDLRFRLESAIAGDPSEIIPSGFEWNMSQGNQDVLDTNAVQVVQVRAQELAGSLAPGYRLLKLRVRFQYSYNFSAAESWAFKVKGLSPGAMASFWGFESEGADETTVETGVTRPYLIEYIEDAMGHPDVTNFAAFVDLPAARTFNFGTVHVNSSAAFARSESYQFINVGTAALEIIGVAETSGGSNVNLPVNGYSADGYFTTPSSVLPMAALTGTVFKFNPTVTGAAADVNIDLTINSTAVPLLEVNLVGGHGIRLKTALLMDVSGSMNDDVHGNRSVDAAGRPTNMESVRKIYKARDAARFFVDVYNQNVPEAEIGLFTYPNLAGVCPSAEQVVNFDAVQDASTFQSLHNERLSRNHANRIRPETDAFLTPMSDGLELVRTSLANVPANTKRLVFMVGDGQHYCPASAKTPAALESALTSSGITFYTVPYGDNNASWTQQLEDIADWTNGDTYPVNVDDEDSLKKRAENVLKEVIGLEVIADPNGSIQRNQIIREKVCVPEDEYVLNFLVRWENERVGALAVALETPDGTRIDQNTALTRPADVGYFETESYIGYSVRGAFLSGRHGVGDWRIELTGKQVIGQGQSVAYGYSVYSQSTLQSGFRLEPWWAGHVSVAELYVGDAVHQIRSVEAATLQYRAPTVSFGTWLATTPVDPQLVVRVPDGADGSLASLAAKKHWVLQNELKQRFNPKPESRTVPLTATQGEVPGTRAALPQQAFAAGAIYTAQLSEARATGAHEFFGKLKGVNIHGDCFEREVSWVHDVRIKFTPELIRKYLRVMPVEVTPLFPRQLADALATTPPRGMVRHAVQIVARDDFGNYAGPGYGDHIKVAVSEGTVLQGMVDNLDGSFTSIIQHESGKNPAISVTVDGVSNTPAPLSDFVESKPSHRWPWLLVAVVVLVLLFVLLKRLFARGA